jgi:uncharacterized delta-60 repeat protein
MKKMLCFLSLLFVISNINAQEELKVFPDWYGSNGTQNFFYKTETKVDASNNIYIAGATLNGSGNYDILLVKYNSSGVAQWTVQYNGDGNWHDVATGLYIDGSANVYITGCTTTSTGVDLVTIKYNSSGTQQWLRTYNGPGNWYDSGADITGDGSGNIYVTGSIYYNSTLTDAITIKYNSSGTQQWAKMYYVAGKCVAGVKLVVNVTGVVVSSLVQMDSVTYRYGVLLYNPTTGNLISSTVSGSSTTGIDQVNDMVQDASGNIYIVGATPVTGHGLDLDVIKLNSSLGIAWERIYNGADSLDDVGKGIAVDASGNVFVTGYKTTTNQGKDIITIKYNSSGTQQWIETYNDTLNMDDEGSEMAIDNNGNIYVTGYKTTDIDSTDYYTIKYNTSGDELWNIRMDGLAHLNDKANNIAIDNNGNIIVTGVSQTATGFLYKTVKYVEKQVITPTDYNSESSQSNFLFFPNQGQLIGTNDTLVPYIKYYTQNSSPSFYIKYGGYSFVFAKADTSSNSLDTLCRVDVSYQRANTNSKPYPLEEQNSFFNYFLDYCSDGRTEIHGNKRVICQDLYTNIDLMYSSNQDGIKFYYIIKPGGDPTNISMVYTGASNFYLSNSTNKLTIYSNIGNISFERPTAYQLDSLNNIIQITGWTPDWQTDGANNKYKFNIGAYDNTKPLIIQVDRGHTSLQIAPFDNLDWSTYLGCNSGSIAYDITTDNDNSMYVTGEINNENLHFPYSAGQLVDQPHGLNDVFVLKFDKDAELKWGLYYGGEANETGYGIADGHNGFIYITGETFSSLLPILSTNYGTYTQSFAGIGDAFVAEILTVNGFIKWQTFFGGEAWDRGTKIAVDANNEIFIIGRTEYSTLFGTVTNGEAPTNGGFPLANPGGAYYQSSFKGTGTGPSGLTNYDCFIAKFNSSKGLVWSTLFGGEDYESGLGLSINKYQEVAVVGETHTSTSGNNYCSVPLNNGFPLCNQDVYFQSSFNSTPLAGTGFIAKFTNNGVFNWSTYFDGIAGGAAYNSNAMLYVSGTTNNPQPSFDFNPPTNGGHPIIDMIGGCTMQLNLGGAYDSYIAEFNDDGNLVWSTYYGGQTSEEIIQQVKAVSQTDITIDKHDYLYITGASQLTQSLVNDFPSLQKQGYYWPNNFQTYQGVPSVYVSAFDNGNVKQWSTLYGGVGTGSVYDGYNNGLALSVSKDMKLYVTGFTFSTNFPYTYPSTINPFHQPYTSPEFFDTFIGRFNVNNLYSGISETSEETNDLKVYPNPVNDKLNLEFYTESKEEVVVLISNVLGQIMYNEKMQNCLGQTIKQISTESLPTGFYIIKLKFKNNEIDTKFIKQ